MYEPCTSYCQKSRFFFFNDKLFLLGGTDGFYPVSYSRKKEVIKVDKT